MKYWMHILGAVCFILLGWFGNTVITKPTIISNCDTVTTVITDSVSLIRAKAELNYLREELKSAEGKIVYKTIVDTITVNSVEFIVPNFEARIDTTFERGNYLSALFEYPSNRFTILHKYRNENVVINNTKTVEEKRLFDFSHGILVGFGYGVISQKLDTFIGYGFKLGLNF